MGLGAKSYMRKGFLIYEEMYKYFTIYEEAVSHTYMTLKFLIYEANFLFFFIRVGKSKNVLFLEGNPKSLSVLEVICSGDLRH